MQQAGDTAERHVREHLIEAGWTILGRNIHVGRAELDLIGVDPGPPQALVVVEVRWRARRDFGLPEETVDHRKLARIRRASFVLRETGTLPNGALIPPLPFRIDLVAMEPGGLLRHHRHVG